MESTAKRRVRSNGGKQTFMQLLSFLKERSEFVIYTLSLEDAFCKTNSLISKEAN